MIMFGGVAAFPNRDTAIQNLAPLSFAICGLHCAMALRALTLVLVCGGAGANALLAARSLGIRELIPDSLAPPERVSTALLQEMECKNVETRVPDNVKMSSDHAAALAMGPASIRERSPRALGLKDAELMSEQRSTPRSTLQRHAFFLPSCIAFGRTRRNISRLLCDLSVPF